MLKLPSDAINYRIPPISSRLFPAHTHHAAKRTMASTEALAPKVEGQVVNAAPSRRVVSLLPGLTDVLIDLGFSSSIVANSHECEISSIRVTAPKIPASDTLANHEIAAGWNAVTYTHPDNTSAQLLQLLSVRICSFYRVDVPALICANPHVLLTHLAKPATPTDMSEEEVRTALKMLIPELKEIVSVNCQTLRDVFALQHTVARAMGNSQVAVDVVASARTKLRSLSLLKVGGMRSCTVVQWTEPLYLAGDWVPGVVRLVCEGDGITAEGGPSVCVDVEDLLAVDVVIFAICAVGLRGCMKVVNEFARRYAGVFRGMRGVFVTDGNKLFARPAVSVVVQTAEVVADIVGGSDRFRYKGVLWDEWKFPVSL